MVENHRMNENERLVEVYPNLRGWGVENQFGKTPLNTADQDLNLDNRVIGNLIYYKCSALDHTAAKAVGGGSAGSVVAARLAKSGKNSVLLIEAGPDCSSRLLNIPVLSPLLLGSKLDWSYKTQPQFDAILQHKNLAHGRGVVCGCGVDTHGRCVVCGVYTHIGQLARIGPSQVVGLLSWRADPQPDCDSCATRSASVWPRGKVLGGSSRINNIVYMRGHSRDYDSWGDSSWSYQEVHKYFPHRTTNGNVSESEFPRGFLPVNELPWTTDLGGAMLRAGEQLGYTMADLNAASQTGMWSFESEAILGGAGISKNIPAPASK
uniref:Glucose-methanol-choline oxidoreductase N-terminal domain-containing protein n=1 Tax=Timema bartmani TaxID=61472 RepID=A0A7R9EUP9_9NEOP|nr:unnamed protein product [Timema bartmani]